MSTSQPQKYTARLTFEYSKVESASPAAELSIIYRELDMEQLLLIEEAYVVKSISSLIDAGRTVVAQQ